MADTPTAWRSSHTGQQIDTAVDKVSDSTLNSSKEGHIITLDSSGNLKASDNTLTEIETLKSDVSRIDSAQSSLENRVGSIENETEEISGRVASLDSRITTMENIMAEQSEIIRLFGIGLANASRDILNLKERVSLLEAGTLPDEVLVIYENDESTE